LRETERRLIRSFDGEWIATPAALAEKPRRFVNRTMTIEVDRRYTKNYAVLTAAGVRYYAKIYWRKAEFSDPGRH
jgi:hypothetical protein